MKRWIISLALCAAAGTAAADTTLIQNARLHTGGPAGTLAQADILIRDGRVAAVASSLDAPGHARVIDAKGRPVTPGLFAALSEIGLVEISGVGQTVDSRFEQARFSAALDVADALNPEGIMVRETRIDGVTRAVAAPGASAPGRLIHGRGAVINLGGGRDFVHRRHAAMFASFGEAAAELAGGSRAGAMLWLREAFAEAQGRDAALPAGRYREAQLSPLDVAALQPVLNGDIPLVIEVHRLADVRAVLALADGYGFRPVISGGAEAWLAAGELAERGVPVIIDPTANLPARFEMLRARADAAAILHRAGVPIAIAGGRTHNVRNIRQLAGNAVRHGLPYDAAIAAISHTPAGIYGVDDELGRIAPRMRADLVIWSGDPLEVTSHAEYVFVDGKEIPLKSRQLELRDRYLQRLGLDPAG